MKKRIISAALAFAMLMSFMVCFTFNSSAATAEQTVSGYTKAKTTAQKNAATTAKSNLSGVIQYYRNYYARVTLTANLQKASVVAYKAELDILEVLLSSSTLYLATYYETEGSGNAEQLWQTFRMELPISNGLTAMRDAYRDQTKPGLDYSSSSIYYTPASWNAYYNTINYIDSIKNSCTDAQGLAAYQSYCAASDALESIGGGVTAAQIQAKNNLSSLMVYYRGYRDRVTLSKYQSDSEYQNYKNNLLPRADALVSSSGYSSAATYQNMENSLEVSWQSWRTRIPISSGVYTFRDRIFSTVGSSSSYNSNTWACYQASLPAINSMLDDLKNSITATDADGDEALAVLQNAVNNLSTTATQTSADITAKNNLASSLEAYRTQLKRDTKTTKSPETTALAQMISNAMLSIGSYTTTASQYSQMLTNMDSYLNNIFMPALFIGQPFINAARELYYTSARQWRSYTTASWQAVSNAINNCDSVKPSGTDAQSAAAYNALETAIANLQPRVANVANLSVTSGIGTPGQTIIIKINIGSSSNMIYGNFRLLFDNTVLEFVTSSDANAKCYDNAIVYTYENPLPLETSSTILQITFKIKDYANNGSTALTLLTDRLRDDGGYLIDARISNGSITVNSGYIKGNATLTGTLSTSDARKILMQAISGNQLFSAGLALADYNSDGIVDTTDARKVLRAVVEIENTYSIHFDTQGSSDTVSPIQEHYGVIAEIPSTVPAKSGYVFDGWYTEPNGEGDCVDGTIPVTKDATLYASWRVFESGALTQDEIVFGGFVAIHNAYAVEDDFKKLAECGVTLILLDYDRANKSRSDQCVRWCEKYGIKAYMHDYNLNALSTSAFTTSKVLQYTADYRNSPAFAGNNLWDEPSNSQFSMLAVYTNIYKQALPNFDMHINLFPNVGVTSLIGITFQEYLNQYISNVTAADHICHDPYPFADNNGTKSVYSQYYAGLSQMANVARDNDLDYWMYPQVLTGMDNYFPDLDDIRFQVYSGLAFGASKFMHYCYHVPGYTGTTYSAEVYAMRDYAGAYTELWDYGQYIHNEVSVFSKVYSGYDWQSAGTYKTGTIPAYLSSISTFSSSVLTNVSSNQPLVIGSFNAKSGTGKAFMITNAADLNNSLSATVSFRANGTVTAYVNGQAELLTPTSGVYTISLKVAQGAFITIA